MLNLFEFRICVQFMEHNHIDEPNSNLPNITTVVHVSLLLIIGPRRHNFHICQTKLKQPGMLVQIPIKKIVDAFHPLRGPHYHPKKYNSGIQEPTFLVPYTDLQIDQQEFIYQYQYITHYYCQNYPHPSILGNSFPNILCKLYAH